MCLLKTVHSFFFCVNLIGRYIMNLHVNLKVFFNMLSWKYLTWKLFPLQKGGCKFTSRYITSVSIVKIPYTKKSEKIRVEKLNAKKNPPIWPSPFYLFFSTPTTPSFFWQHFFDNIAPIKYWINTKKLM